MKITKNEAHKTVLVQNVLLWEIPVRGRDEEMDFWW